MYFLMEHPSDAANKVIATDYRVLQWHTSMFPNKCPTTRAEELEL